MTTPPLIGSAGVRTLGKLAEETHLTKPEITGIAPFFIVKNVPAALSFYRDRLGFDITFQGPSDDDIFLRHCPAGCGNDHPKGRRCRQLAEAVAEMNRVVGRFAEKMPARSQDFRGGRVVLVPFRYLR